MTTKRVKGKKAGGTRRRLSEEQKLGIANEPESLTLAKIAEKYDTSIATVSKYRKTGGIQPKMTVTSPKQSPMTTKHNGASAVTIPIKAAFDTGGNLRLNITRKDLLKMLAETER